MDATPNTDIAMKQEILKKVVKLTYVTKNIIKDIIKGNFAMLEANDHVSDFVT